MIRMPEWTPGTRLSPLPFFPLGAAVNRPTSDEHGLGLFQRHPAVEIGDYEPPYERIFSERCQWDGALLHFATFSHGPWDSPEPETISYCWICQWEMTW